MVFISVGGVKCVVIHCKTHWRIFVLVTKSQNICKLQELIWFRQLQYANRDDTHMFVCMYVCIRKKNWFPDCPFLDMRIFKFQCRKTYDIKRFLLCTQSIHTKKKWQTHHNKTHNCLNVNREVGKRTDKPSENIVKSFY